MVCFIILCFQNHFNCLVEVPRRELLERLRDHIDGVRAMFTCPGEQNMDRDKEILVPFELFTTYMQHVCRALAIRLLMPDLAECIARKDQHGRLATALVSSIPFPTTLTCLQGDRGLGEKSGLVIVIQKKSTSVVVFILFPKHKAVVVFDPVFSWTKRGKPPLDPSPESEEFFEVKAVFASISISYCEFRTSSSFTT